MEQAYHHIEPRKFSSSIKNLLHKGGYIIISESNALNPLIQLWLLKKEVLKL